METGKDLPCILVQEIGGSFGVMEEHVDYLEERFTLITMKELKEKKEQVADKIVCIFNWANKPDVDKELLECLPQLKVIASAGAGVDHLNLKMISSYGVKVANTPNAVTNSTADLAMTLLLVSARSFLEGHKIAMSPDTEHFHANWVSRGDITGNTVGIIGMGKIGYKIAQRAKAFEMKILYHNRHQRIRTCHHCTEDFYRIQMPDRRPVVDQDALVEALQVGEIKAAALDVTYPEPLP
ncbi:hypothetical protein AB205_0120210, partial [Aquarana catesbeiana]